MAKHLKFGMEKNYKMVIVQNFHVVFDNFRVVKICARLLEIIHRHR
jgi:hypothetical protein